MEDFSYVTNSHPAYIESIYNQYLENPETIDPELKKFFEGFDFAIGKAGGSVAPHDMDPAMVEISTAKISPWQEDADQTFTMPAMLRDELSVFELIRSYRKRGHLVATTNPVRPRIERKAYLELSNFGLSDADLDREFYAGRFVGLGKAKLRDIVSRLNFLYTGNIGIQYTYMNRNEAHLWVQHEFEKLMDSKFELKMRERILAKLNYATIFEKFLATKYIGQKRFGLEGGESLIPALDAIINTSADSGTKEITIGMAHRGRLNVLANILRKTYDQIFTEFEGNMPLDMIMGSGDVKYHLGFHSNLQTMTGKEVNIQMLPNPSHLEVVGPVMSGFTRAKADVLYEEDYTKILPILIHGDAAIAAQGVVYELLQMSRLEGYKVGGTIHFVINNQLGFTTDFTDGRSTDYCTSLAAMVHAPVLHVNGDDPEAVVKAAIFATNYHQKFHDDIFIDMVGYRRHGHNEGDEPKFTQPKLYQLIDKHPTTREIYTKYLLDKGEAEAKEMAKTQEEKFWNELQARFDEIKQKPFPYANQEPEKWWDELRSAKPNDFLKSPDTSISAEVAHDLFNKMTTIPENFKALRKVAKIFKNKVKLLEENNELDWGSGELLAYASLLYEGHDVRLAGEDSKRGTFSHRHATIMDENTNIEYNRLSQLKEGQGRFFIYNSLLSEYAAMGYEYGYALANPNNLVLWEAQFGDFANGAQSIYDEYVVSAEQKWGIQNGVVILLPHGYEGAGPDHSSARIERFLQQCADLNMFVCNITTAANFFHGLRRQLKLPFRIPMVNFTPKANLRQVRAHSKLEEFTQGSFQEVLDDPQIKDPDKVKRVLMCSGKIYFDLSDYQISNNRSDIAIIRLEQLYPLPQEQIDQLHERYAGAQWLWVQEEPRNMGAASYLKMNLKNVNIGYLTRQASASPATGFAHKHAEEQTMLINEAFRI